MFDSAFLGKEFINLYSKENQILNINDNCYFLLTNTIDYHRPIICYGQIIDDKFTDGLNKVYFIQLNEVLESLDIVNKFFMHKTFNIYPYENSILKNKKLIQITEEFQNKQTLFKIEAFFVRDNLQKIIELKDFYSNIIKSDLNRMLSDIDSTIQQ